MRINFKNFRIKVLLKPFLLPVVAAVTMIGIWAPLAANSQNLVVNGSFEQPGRATDQYTVTFQSLPTNYITGWLLGASGVAYGNGNAYDGICGGNGFTQGNYEDGTNCIFLQGGYAATTVTLTAGNNYTLSFWAMGRTAAGNGENPVAVTVGNFFSNTVTPANTSENMLNDWAQHLYNFTPPSNGVFALTFQATIPYGPSGDHTTFIDSVSITPGGVPPSFTSQPLPEEMIYAGETVRFSAQATGIPTPACQWQIESNGVFVNLNNNSRISGATSSMLTIGNLVAGDATNYLLHISNAVGSTNSSTAELVAVSPPAPGSYDSAVLALNPVAYYELTETTDPATGTAAAYDYVGGCNGVYGAAVQNGFNNVPGPTTADGFPDFPTNDFAALFTSSGINSPNPNSAITLTPWQLNTNTVTFTAWINPSGVQTPFSGLVYVVGGSDGLGFNFTAFADANGNETLGYSWNYGSGTYNWNSGIAPATGQWSFVALVITPTNATVFILNANGTLTATNIYNHVVEPFSSVPLFGYFPNAGGTYNYNGLMDHVGIYGRSLSAKQIAALYDASVQSGQNLVANGNFEQPGVVNGEYTVPFGSLATNAVPGWAFGVSTGTTPGVYDGLVSEQGGLNDGNIEAGTNAAFLQGGSMSQNVVLQAGSYNLSFWAMGRSDTGTANPVVVSVGNLLSQTVAPDNSSQNSLSDWQNYVFSFSAPSNGTYVLEFQATLPYNPPSDHTTFIDNVSILSIPAIPSPTIISEPAVLQMLYVGQSAQFTLQASSTSPISYQWQVETDGIYANLANGGRFSGAASATLIISNLDVGDSTNYRVRLTNAGGTTNSTVATLTVLAAPPPGSPKGAVTVINPSFEDSQQSGDIYTTGYGTLNPQTGIPGWQFGFSEGDAYSGIVTESGTIFGTPKYIPDCWQAAFIQGTGQFSQGVTFYTAGTYLVRFRAAGWGNAGAAAEPISILVDGNGVGTFTPLKTQWSLYTSFPFSVAAGVHVIAFSGTVPSTVAGRASFIDGVQIVTPAEAIAAVPPTSPVYDIVFVGDSITYGATLADPAMQASAAQCMQSLGTRFNMGVRMSNQGHSGATTVDWLPASSYFQGAVAAAAALETSEPGQLVFSIMLGANDSAQSGTDGAPVSPADYDQNLQAIINELLTDYANADVFVHYPTWYSTNTHNGALYGPAGAALLKAYLPQIDLLVASNAVLHPGHVFAGDKLAYGYFETNYLALLTPESGVDGTFYLHPNAAGAIVLGAFWANAIVAPLNVTSNDSYVAWLQSGDLTPGAPGTGFGDTPTNSLVRNGVSYGDPAGLIATLAGGSLDVFADIRSDTNLTVVIENSTDLINWSPFGWSIDPSQSGVATGFVRHAIQVPISYLQQEEFYRLVLGY
ncbi:MAG: LamG-like jellyroll fold domain-containing protein [Verrucomicrobiota bacterium]